MRRVAAPRMKLYDPVEFIHDVILPAASFRRRPETIAVHVPCSARRMGLADKFDAVARALAGAVVLPGDVHCCGFAGDRGFTHPELNRWALKDLGPAVSGRCVAGYSSSRTCEIGLSVHGGMFYRSMVYLAEQCMIQ